MVKVAILGYGTVGSGVFEVFEKNKEVINEKANQDVLVKYVLDLREFQNDPVEKVLVHDYTTILEDSEISVICETMGGLHPAYEFTKSALLKGKSVCTSNKELVAEYGPELIQLAKENKCNYFFEASVGGGIPIIRTMQEALTPEIIESITGILNGTTNYILTKMAAKGCDFSDVLKEAQEKGYAEKNPEADVEGYDTGRKIAILTSLACKKTVSYEDIYIEGITNINAKDFLYAKELECSIKLLAVSKIKDGKVFAFVAPFLVQKEHALYNVSDVFNAVLIRGNMLGDSMYYGRGAGKLPTASAVIADVIAAAKSIGENIPCLWSKEKQKVENMDTYQTRFLVRIKGNAEEILCKLRLKDTNNQMKLIELPGLEGEFAIVTDYMSETEYKDSIGKFEEVITRIRMEA